MFIKKKLILGSDNYKLETRHYCGMPPEVTEDVDQRTLLPKATVLVIEETKEGFFLYRYTKTGESAGDTWHQNLSGAIKQAEFEFGVKEGRWEDIPGEIPDWYSYIFKRH